MVKGERSVCRIGDNNPQPNQIGYFDQVYNIRPSQKLPIEITYPEGRAGENVIVIVADGGLLEGKQLSRVLQLTSQKKINFNFQASGDNGIYRIVVRKGNDIKVVRLWVGPNPLANNNERSPYIGGGRCGNPSSHGPASYKKPCPPEIPTGDPFNPFTGNEHRVVADLQMWGAVGEIPMIWRRYYNSREFAGWTYSFHFLMADNGTNSNGQPEVIIRFPEGEEIIFAQDAGNPSHWLPVFGVEYRLFQYGNNFFLQRPDGSRYRFQKFINPQGSWYQLQDIRDKYQNLYTLSYDQKNNLSRVTEPAGRYFDIIYTTPVPGGQEVISKVTSNDGRSVQYKYTVYMEAGFSWPLLTVAEYGDGTRASYTYYPPHYSGAGFMYLESARDPRIEVGNPEMKFTYDNTIARGYIKQEINGRTGEVMNTLTAYDGGRWICYANGRVQHLVMPADGFGQTTEYTDGLGRTHKYTYDANGFISAATDALGRTTKYVMSAYNNFLQVTHPDGAVEKWTRDSLDLVLTYTDEMGRKTTYTRDSRHRVTKITYANNTTEHFTYNQFGQVLKHTFRNGGVEETFHDLRGLKTGHIDPLDQQSVYTYDAADRLASLRDKRHNIERYEYNERGLLVKQVNKDNSVLKYEYDDFGNLVSSTNEIGKTWKAQYDEFKRITSSTDPLDRQTKFTYDLPGGGCGCLHDRHTPTQIILPSGKIIKIEYDVEWQKIKQTIGAGTPDAATTQYEYDVAGNVTAVIDPRMKTTTYGYDLRNRLVTETDPLNNTTGWKYDFVGNIVSKKRADGTVTNYDYDSRNLVVQTTNAKGQVTRYEYDVEGNIRKLIDAENQEYIFEHDLLNRRTKTIHPNGTFEAYGYDAVNNLTRYRDRAGKVRSYFHDIRSREVMSVWNDSVRSVMRTYDAAGRLLTLNNGVSALTYTYNDANEMTSEWQAIEGTGGARQVKYQYNADGLRSAMIYPSLNTALGYQYTARNQVSSITANGGPLVHYMYDLAGNRINKKLINGTVAQYQYDDANQVLEIMHQRWGISFARFNYGYDEVKRRTFVKRDNHKGDVYRYDPLDQLTDVQYEVSNPETAPGGSIRTVNYFHDATGNRLFVKDNGTLTNYNLNNMNQYVSVGGSSLNYTVDGHLSIYKDWKYDYDAQGRLIRAVKGDSTITFAYDGRNRCVQRTINGQVSFLYYDEWKLVEEMNAGGQITQYAHGAETDELLAKKTGADGIVFYHHDALGNTVRLTNGAGNVVEQYTYDVYGSPVFRDGAGNVIAASAFGNRFLFTGREFIQALNLYDYRNRMYSPELGRFLQVDPIGFSSGDVNFYRYVGNNPVNWKDPTGTITIPHPPHRIHLDDGRIIEIRITDIFLDPCGPRTRVIVVVTYSASGQMTLNSSTVRGPNGEHEHTSHTGPEPYPSTSGPRAPSDPVEYNLSVLALGAGVIATIATSPIVVTTATVVGIVAGIGLIANAY